MRASRSLLAAAALALLAACAADPTEMTAPSDASFDGGTWIGSGNFTDGGTTQGDNGGMGTGHYTPSDTTVSVGGGWIGTGN